MTILDRADPAAVHLSVTVDLLDGRIVLSGEFDRATAHHLLDALAMLVPTRHSRWELDAAGVTFCDAGGLRALAEAARFADQVGRGLTVVAASRCVRRLLGLTGLAQLMSDPDSPVRQDTPERASDPNRRGPTSPVPAHS